MLEVAGAQGSPEEAWRDDLAVADRAVGRVVVDGHLQVFKYRSISITDLFPRLVSL